MLYYTSSPHTHTPHALSYTHLNNRYTFAVLHPQSSLEQIDVSLAMLAAHHWMSESTPRTHQAQRLSPIVHDKGLQLFHTVLCTTDPTTAVHPTVFTCSCTCSPTPTHPFIHGRTTLFMRSQTLTHTTPVLFLRLWVCKPLN